MANDAERLLNATIGQFQLPGDPGRAVGANVPLPSGQQLELGVRFALTRSGILVPEDTFRAAAPIDRVATFVTDEEIFGQRIPDAVFEEMLGRVPTELAFEFVGAVMAEYRKPGTAKADVDRALVDVWFNEPIRSQVHRLLNSGNRVLVAPQALFVLLKQVLLRDSDEPTGESQAPLPALLIAVMSNLGIYDDVQIADEDYVVATTPGRLGRELIANQHLNGEVDFANLLARFHARWLSADSTDLEQLYGRVTGVPLRDFLTVALIFWAANVNGQVIVPELYFSTLEWPEDRLSSALALICCDVGTMRDLVVAEVEHGGLEWTMSTFERYPVARLSSDSYVVLDPGMLTKRAFGWLPLFDVTSVLRESSNRADRKLADQAEQKVRRLGEDYILTILEGMCGSETRRVYRDDSLRKSFLGRKIADAAISYGDSWIIVEVTTMQLRRDSVYALSDEAIEADFEKMIEEVRQIHATIEDLRDRESDLTHLPNSVPSRTFYPLLVMTEGFPVNPISVTVIRERAAASGLLQDSDIAPLEVIDTVELEMIESLQEHGGPSLRDLLRDKRSAGLWRASMRQYILDERQLKPTRSQRVQRLWSGLIDSLSDPLRALPGRN